jgi:hypothetical protein
MLEVLGSRGLAATVFVVGQDAMLERNRGLLAGIRKAGHDIANHSFHHRPAFASGTPAEIEREIGMAEEAIERATGTRPVGFRGPGFSLSAEVLRVLVRRGYRYDASSFPTFFGPLARAFYRRTVPDGAAGADERAHLYGGWRDGLRPLTPYRWQLPEGSLLELPVTTLPFARVPFHMTYLLHLAVRAPRLALGYLRAALQACRVSGTTPSMLLHALDFLGSDDVPELGFFPGMGLSGSRKAEFVGEALDVIAAGFGVLSLEQHAGTLARRANDLPARRFPA